MVIVPVWVSSQWLVVVAGKAHEGSGKHEEMVEMVTGMECGQWWQQLRLVIESAHVH